MCINIVLWNANGLLQHLLEVKSFLYTVDILLVSEPHFTNTSFCKIQNNTTYHIMHSDGTAHAGTAIIIKNSVMHSGNAIQVFLPQLLKYILSNF